VVFSAVLINASHAPLEDRKEAFNGICAGIATLIFTFSVMYTFMLVECAAGLFIVPRFVGV
jgi:hypothetical protein